LELAKAKPRRKGCLTKPPDPPNPVAFTGRVPITCRM
jgi:hypothetical protein